MTNLLSPSPVLSIGQYHGYSSPLFIIYLDFHKIVSLARYITRPSYIYHLDITDDQDLEVDVADLDTDLEVMLRRYRDARTDQSIHAARYLKISTPCLHHSQIQYWLAALQTGTDH